MKNFRIAMIVFLAMAILFVIWIVSPMLYHSCYKPHVAGRKIAAGISEIRKANADGVDRETHFRRAEELFAEVGEDYVKNDARAYNGYAAAYLEAGEHDRAFTKLLASLRIDFDNPATLNRMGAFFYGIPDDRFDKYKTIVLNDFGKKPRPKTSLSNKYDFALYYYCRSLAGNDKDESLRNVKDILSIQYVERH